MIKPTFLKITRYYTIIGIFILFSVQGFSQSITNNVSSTPSVDKQDSITIIKSTLDVALRFGLLIGSENFKERAKASCMFPSENCCLFLSDKNIPTQDWFWDWPTFKALQIISVKEPVDRSTGSPKGRYHFVEFFEFEEKEGHVDVSLGSSMLCGVRHNNSFISLRFFKNSDQTWSYQIIEIRD